MQGSGSNRTSENEKEQKSGLIRVLKRCRDQTIIPNCVKLKFHRMSRVDKILKTAGFSLSRVEIAETRHLLN